LLLLPFQILNIGSYEAVPLRPRNIKALMLELIGDMEERETDDMALKSWTPEDYKAFGRNELRGQLMKDINNL
jgi:hypothetical protein